MNDEGSSFRKKRKSKALAPLQAAWNSWAESIPPSLRSVVLKQTGEEEVADVRFKVSIVAYDNLLIINRAAFSKGVLSTVVGDAQFSDARESLWAAIARVFGVEHIGVSGPIPLAVPDNTEQDHIHMREAVPVASRLDNGNNILRLPVGFQPLHGDFGWNEDSRMSYSRENADRMFWAQATQYKLKQIWCPLRTMFSHGNIKEKGRILDFQQEESACAVVDLYAGIGYFAFCYRKKIATVVLGWEINPWSIEGFRKGALANGWGEELHVVQEDETFSGHGHNESFWERNGYNKDSPTLKQGLVMFAESNGKAGKRIGDIRSKIPPVRHVNCGYLPTSEPSWKTAVQAIDPDLGGLIHAHENIAIDDIKARASEVERYFQTLVEQFKDSSRLNRATCVSIAPVKTYAPGVMHFVMDIRIFKDT